MEETQTAGGRRFRHQYFLSPAAVPPSVDRPLGGNGVPGDRERESDKQTQEAESGDKKYRVARTPLSVPVDTLCQDVGVPPDGSKGQRGNTYYLK